MSNNKSVFETLNAINVNDKVEHIKSGNRKLSYLSWAWAWAELKKNYPDATYKIYENVDGWNYHHDGITAWVKTGVTINGTEHIEYLPIMNNYNKSIALADITSFHVNSSIQRSLTKAIARHGLGLYIYAGEDLPESSEEVKPKSVKATTIELNIGDDNWSNVLAYVVKNKDKGLAEIGKQLSKKYSMKPDVKNAIKEAHK